MTRPELRPLTSVRGLFAWAVVLFHFRPAATAWAPPGVLAVLAKGYLAVDFFFLLSGFVIWLSYAERLRAGGAAADFLVRRLARVWPLHAAVLGLFAIMAIVIHLCGRAGPHFPFELLPLHLAMMQNWGFSDGLMWNDAAWSISCEWMAYLLTPLVAIGLPRWRLPTAALVAAALAPLLLLHGILAACGVVALNQDISHFGLVRCLAEFGCGAIMSTIWQRWRGRSLPAVGCWLAVAIAAAAWAAGAPETLIVPLLFALLLLALALGAEWRHHPLSGRLIHGLGEISYATYLIHFAAFMVFKLLFVSDEFDVPPVRLFSFLLFLLFLSVIVYRMIERPAQRAILRAWAGRSLTRPRST